MNEAEQIPDLLPSFLPRLEVKTLAQLSRFRQIVHFRVPMLWPFSTRDMVFDAQGIDRLSGPERGIYVSIRCLQRTTVLVADS